MKFARYQGEKKISEISERLMPAETKGIKGRKTEFEAALLRVNPHLRDLKKLIEGSLIVLPDDLESIPEHEFDPVMNASQALLHEMPRALEGLRAVLDAQARQASQETKQSIDLLRSRQVKSQARQDKDFQKLVAKLDEDANARLKEIKARQKVHKQALAQASEDLKVFIEQFGQIT
jgi:hypothetical protein